MKIALVLGSGGARGWAHIGAIEEIERRGHEIVAVSGASVGALVGGIYAAGKLPELTEWILGLTKSDVRSLLDFTISKPGLLKGEKVLSAIEEITGSPNIEDLNIPFTAVAVDILTGREVWFQHGAMYLAIRASISIPTFFTPVRIGNRILVDGGVLNPMPIEPTLPIGADATIGVDLRGPAIHDPREILYRDDASKHDNHETSLLARAAESTQSGLSSLGAGWQRTKRSFVDTEFFQRFEQGWTSNGTAGEEDPLGEELAGNITSELATESGPERDYTDMAGSPEANPAGASQSAGDMLSAGELPDGLRTMEVMSLSIGTMEDAIARYRAAANPVAATIKIPKDAVGDLDYHRGKELIEMGRESAIEALDAAGL